MSHTVTPLAACPTSYSDKQQAIITAATRIFLEQGYSQASMDRIARSAGVSKQTIYNQFGNKEALFRAIINQRCAELLSLLLEGEQDGSDIEAILTRFATTLLNILLEPSALALHRLIIAESRRLPRVGRIYHESGPARGNQQLACYLETLCQRGILCIDDTTLAAQQFTGALVGSLRSRALVLDQPATQAEIDQVVDHTVKGFLALYQPARYPETARKKI